MSPFTFVAHAYNLLGTIRWTERRPSLERFFRLHRPDVVGTQELTPEACELIARILPAVNRVDDPHDGWTNEGNIFWDADLFDALGYGTADINILEGDRRLTRVRLRIKVTGSTSSWVTSTTTRTRSGCCGTQDSLTHSPPSDAIRCRRIQLHL